jgi:cysteine desulfurase
MNKPIYLDYNSTTPVSKKVLDAMLPYFMEEFGNPSSRTHIYGQTAGKAVEDVRASIAKSLKCESQEIFFTSGATESNNIAVLGIMREQMKNGNTHFITSQIEHKAILEPALQLEREGCSVTFIPPQSNGIIDPLEVERAITSNTGLISIMAVNNEIGTIQPIQEIGRIARKNSILFHTDAAQAIGKLQVNLQELPVDLMSISGHKIFGPKGVGGLYIKKYRPKIKMQPVTFGGGHEKGVRSGTLATPLIVGLAKAIELIIKDIDNRSDKQRALRDRFLNKLAESGLEYEVNGDLEQRVPGNLNLHIIGQDAEALMIKLKDKVAISSGSACTSDTYEASYVLKALGLSEYEARCSIRIGFWDELEYFL